MNKKIIFGVIVVCSLLVATLLPIYYFSGRVYVDGLDGPSMRWSGLHTYFILALKENYSLITEYPQNISLGVRGLIGNVLVAASLVVGMILAVYRYYSWIQNYFKPTIGSLWKRISVFGLKLLCMGLVGLLPIFTVYDEYNTVINFSELRWVYWKYFFRSFYDAFHRNLFYVTDVGNVLQLQALMVNMVVVYALGSMLFTLLRVVRYRFLSSKNNELER